MAKSRFEYVRSFEIADSLLKNAWIVVRIDGRSFHRFTSEHQFRKPNDDRGLNLMNNCAMAVMQDMSDIVLAYGQSDEYSFIIDRKSSLYRRRSSKLISTIVSMFSSSYVMKWSEHFGNYPLKFAPCFDGRVILYPTDDNVKDYLRWRQADCHINNLYNTAFWSLVQQGGRSNIEAEQDLMGTDSSDKNELLFSRFGINYNNEPAMHRKGSVLVRYDPERPDTKRTNPQLTHLDLIGNDFWSKLYPNVIR